MNYLGVTNKANTQKLFCRERFEKCKSLYRKDLFGHFGCVNAVEFSSDGQWLVSGLYLVGCSNQVLQRNKVLCQQQLLFIILFSCKVKA